MTNNTEAVYRGPTFTEGTDTTRTFEETFGDATVTTATNIGQPVAATDPDIGETLTYTLEGTDAGKFDIVSTSGQLLTKVGTKYDYEQQRTYSVTVVVEDSDDNSAEIMVVAERDRPERAAAGADTRFRVANLRVRIETERELASADQHRSSEHQQLRPPVS